LTRGERGDTASLTADAHAKVAWEKFSCTRRREYGHRFDEAKKEPTRIERIARTLGRVGER